MPNVTSTLLQIIDMEVGGNDNTWGATTTDNLTKLENAIAASETIPSTGGATTLTDDQARDAVLSFSGTLASDHTVTVPSRSKWWLVKNGHTLGSYALKFKTSGGTAVSLPATPVYSLVYCDGADIFVLGDDISNERFASMANNTVKGNVSGGAAVPSDLTMAQLGAALGYLPAPQGTKMLFGQTAAPTGWTKSTDYNEHALRVVSGTASSGGTVDFSTAFASKSVNGTVGDTTLTIDQIPAHTHTTDSSQGVYGAGASPTTGASPTDGATGSAGGGLPHNHSFTGTAINLAVKYLDVILATKD